MEPRFINGIDLARAYWHEVAAPILDELLPGIPRAAARIGAGSDVLGFDTERSTDHGWGPRVVVLLANGSDPGREQRTELLKAIDARLPATFRGFPTRFSATGEGPDRHQITLTTVSEWFTRHLGFDALAEISDEDWLATPFATAGGGDGGCGLRGLRG
jgi:hypothetical protein